MERQSEIKHTPGPWTLGPEGKPEARRWILMYQSEDPTLGVEPLAFVQWASEEDARLIAAAPDLLEALKTASKALNSLHGASATSAATAWPALEIVDAAIAKAGAP